MPIYQTTEKRLKGSTYAEIYRAARSIYKSLASKTKRRPYVRSKYFNKEKIFLDYFWEHLIMKNPNDRLRRLKYYSCAIDLIQNSRSEPISKENPSKRGETLYRFSGVNGNHETFHVQIKEHKKSGEKHFISVFP